MKKSRLYLLALLIAAVGLGGFFYKWKVLRFPVQPVAETEVYELQARVEFQPRRGPNKVTLQVPFEPPGFAILGERFVLAYTAVKESEYDTFLRVISSWEREHLLLNV